MKRYLRFLPALLWMVIIFYFSSRSTAGIGDTEVFRFIFFKSLHLAEYGILGMFLFFGFKKINITIITAYIYALSDEVHQSFVPGRHPKFSDTLIDLLGIVIGVIFIRFIHQKFFRPVNIK